jgi:nickel transport protein
MEKDDGAEQPLGVVEDPCCLGNAALVNQLQSSPHSQLRKRSLRINSPRQGLLIFFALLGIASPLRAHDLGVDCSIRKGKVVVEAFYDDDSPAVSAKVKVLNVQQAVVAEGMTDTKGLWTFPIPPPGKYQVIVDAGAGHRSAIRITVPANERGSSGAGQSLSISDRPPRADATRFPWVRIVIGVCAIVVFFFVLMLIRRPSLRPEPPSNP